MMRCAKCEDVIDTHTCAPCQQRHQCLIPSCDCHRFPMLPHVLGSMRLATRGEVMGQLRFNSLNSPVKNPDARQRRVDELKSLKKAGVVRRINNWGII